MRHLQRSFVLAVLLIAGCGSESGSMGEMSTELSSLPSDDRFLYFQCGATGWGVDDQTRLIQGSTPEQWTITYDVTKPWMTTDADRCTVLETNQYNGWGTDRTFYDKRGNQWVTVPSSGTASGRLQAWRHRHDPYFYIRYPNVGRYQATFDWASKSFTIGPASTSSWKIQFLLYTDTDVSLTDSQGVARHVVANLSPTERDRTQQVATQFALDQVPRLSSGNQRPTFEITTPQHSISRVSSAGKDCYWPAREDVIADIDRTADSVVVFWDASGTDENSGNSWSLMPCAAGLTSDRGVAQTYVAMQVNWWFDSWRFENDLKHEWGHSILFYYNATGASPNPAVNNHQPESYLNCMTGEPYVVTDDPSVANSYYNLESGFTHDYYSGLAALRDNPTVCLGITPSTWAKGGPASQQLKAVELPNSGFEDVTGEPPLPSVWQTAAWGEPVFSVDESEKRSGAYSARIDAATSTDARYVQNVSVEPNSLYHLSGYVKTDHVQCEASAGGAVLSAESAGVWPYLSDAVSGTSDGWVFVYTNFKTSSQTTIEVQARLGMYSDTCTGTAWFDDLTLSRAE